MKVKYIGPHTEGVEIADASGFCATVAHGDTVEVPDGIGRALLDQPGNWQPANPVKAPKAAVPEED